MQGPSLGQGSGQLQSREARLARCFCWRRELEAGTLQDEDTQNVEPGRERMRERKRSIPFVYVVMLEGKGTLGKL